MSSSFRRMLPLPHTPLTTVLKWNNGTIHVHSVFLEALLISEQWPSFFFPTFHSYAPEPKLSYWIWRRLYVAGLYTTETNVAMIILCSHCSVSSHSPCCSWAVLHLLLLMLLCFLLLNFLLCLFVFTLPLAYVHPTHTSHQPLELHMKHHSVAPQPASACRFGVGAAGWQSAEPYKAILSCRCCCCWWPARPVPWYTDAVRYAAWAV